MGTESRPRIWWSPGHRRYYKLPDANAGHFELHYVDEPAYRPGDAVELVPDERRKHGEAVAVLRALAELLKELAELEKGS